MFPTYHDRSLYYTVFLFSGLVSLVHGLPTITSNCLRLNKGGAVDSTFAIVTRQRVSASLAKFPSGPLNQFLRIMSSLPKGEKALDLVGKVLTPLQQDLATRTGIETMGGDLAQNSPCADVTVIFARGPTEPGNLGIVAGPPLFDALSEQLGGKSLAVQGVEYPATFAGFNKNGTGGVPSMTDFINQAITTCPDTKVVMSGYSQGALVVRGTADTLPADTMSKINSVVTFGDPQNQTAITGATDKTLTICHENDAVCAGGFITVDHLTYGEDDNTAAQFVTQRANGEWQ